MSDDPATYVRRWDCDGCRPANCPGCVLPFDAVGALMDALLPYDVPARAVVKTFLELANHTEYRRR